jgi:hypothetical protein
MWFFTLCWAFFTVGTSGLTFYQPTVVANLGFTSIAKSQLLNIPTAFLTVSIIAIFGLWADTARLPRPLFPLCFLIVILACYTVLYTFPNTGGVYAATIIASSVASSWYPMMCKSSFSLPRPCTQPYLVNQTTLTCPQQGPGASKLPPAQQGLPSPSAS